MKDTGCVFINYGIEAMDNTVFEKHEEGLREEQVVKGVEMTQEVELATGSCLATSGIRRTLDKPSSSSQV